jgi:Flp pilus assembly CpaE family ATPase
VNSAHISTDFGTKHASAIGANTLSIALVGPDKGRRSAMRKALVETRRANVREFDSYPPEADHLKRLLASVDAIVIDLDSAPEVALGLVEKASGSDAARFIVYSQNSDPELTVRAMRAGVRECLLLPLEQGAVAEALARTASLRGKAAPSESTEGKLLVFVGSKGGSGVTTVACNVAIAMAQERDQRILLVDLALPIGDVALSLGIAATHSTEDALRKVDQLDGRGLQELLVKHQSGVFVLAAPTKVPEVQVSKAAIDKLMAIARREFDHVIVDVGSRIDVAAKALFEDASTIYLVTQTGISDLRNSNRLISQFFVHGTSNLEIVVNRFESRSNDTANEDVIAKALGRPVRWKIPDDQDAARALQHGDIGLTGERISRISLEMASSISGRASSDERTSDFDQGGPGSSMPHLDNETPSTWNSAPAHGRPVPTITWPSPNPLTYGDKLSPTQLNAKASVAGTYVYTPGPGYVLPAGTHTVWVTFTPADSAGDPPVQSSVTINVVKATPEIFWPTPGEISCGEALNENQLNARSSVPGRFNYSPAAGEVLPPGPHKLSVTFTPSDLANYNAAMATVQLSVARAKATIEWRTPDPITYGTQLTNTQLCASPNIQGTFEYTPGLGAVLAAGVHKLTATFTPADLADYIGSQKTVSLTVAKATPSIAWQMPEPIADGVALNAAQLNATSTVPGTLAYTPAAGEVLRPGVHTLSVTFTPTDTLNYTTARATVSLTVTEKQPTHITWQAPAPVSYGTALGAAQLNARASVPGTFTYTPSAGNVLAPGKYILSVSFMPADTEKYASSQAEVELEVEGSPEIDSLPNAEPEKPSEWNFLGTGSAPANPAQNDVIAEAQRSSNIASPSTEAPEPQFTWTFTAINSVPADSAPAGVSGERTAAKTTPHETRVYKGAVYEKGDDGKWHLQKN